MNSYFQIKLKCGLLPTNFMPCYCTKLGGEYQREISLSKKLGLSVSLITED